MQNQRPMQAVVVPGATRDPNQKSIELALFDQAGAPVNLGAGGGGGAGAPDDADGHSPTLASRQAITGYDSVTGYFGGEESIFVDVRNDIEFVPPLEDDKGYFIEILWGGETMADGALISTSTSPSADANNFVAVRQHRGPTPSNEGTQDLIYMAPGYTILLETRTMNSRFALANAWGVA